MPVGMTRPPDEIGMSFLSANCAASASGHGYAFATQTAPRMTTTAAAPMATVAHIGRTVNP